MASPSKNEWPELEISERVAYCVKRGWFVTERIRLFGVVPFTNNPIPSSRDVYLDKIVRKLWEKRRKLDAQNQIA